MPPTPAQNLQADAAWAQFAKTAAHTLPKHLHNAQLSWNAMRQLRKR